MSLPTLPEPWRTDADGEEHYSPVCMKAYGQQCRDAALDEITRLRALIKKAQSESELIDYKGKAAIVVPYSFMRAATEMPEQAQAVEPVGYVYWAKGHAEGALDNQNLRPGTPLYTHPAPPPAGDTDDLTIAYLAGHAKGVEAGRKQAQHVSDENSVEYWKSYAEAGVESFNLMMIELTALRAQQAQAVEPVAWLVLDEARASLIRRADASVTALNSRIMEPFYCSLDQDAARVLSDCVDMLKADAKEIEATERQVETLSDDISKCSKQAQQVAVPDGYVLVPLIPTPSMIVAGRNAPMCTTAASSVIEDYIELYKAMLAAAPQGDKT